MLLRRKVDRAMKWSRARSLQAEGIDPEEEELKAELRKHSSKKEEIPSREELMAEEKQKELQNLEKGEVRALILSAVCPAALGVSRLIVLIAYSFMVH